MKISDLKNSRTFKKTAHFIRNNSIFDKISKIEKPFPGIGLSNCLEKCDVEFDGKPAYIGFTSSGITGFWDLATMSMRGVCSCMHWENSHRDHLVGSVTDPFLGMVYISDNEMTPYGISFRRRSLVRVLYDYSTKEYVLFIERVYKDTGNKNPGIYINKDPNYNHTMKVFRDWIISKLKADSKYKVIIASERIPYSCDLIRSDSLVRLTHPYRSMSDWGFNDSHVEDSFAKKFAAQD